MSARCGVGSLVLWSHASSNSNPNKLEGAASSAPKHLFAKSRNDPFRLDPAVGYSMGRRLNFGTRPAVAWLWRGRRSVSSNIQVQRGRELARLLRGSCRFLRRRWGRCHVLFDQIPKCAREQERDDFRLPVFQNQFLHHKSSAAKFRRFVFGTFPG